MSLKTWVLLAAIALPWTPFASEEAALSDTVQLSDEVSVCLRDPVLSDGVLTTESGGVLTAPGLRIQAQCLETCYNKGESPGAIKVKAEGDLLLEYCDHIFSGCMMEYDFEHKRGIIYNGRGMLYPWYTGAQYVELLPGGEYVLHNGFLSTSNSWQPDWRLCVSRAYINRHRMLTAKNVQFRLMNLPLFWTPLLKTNLNWLADSPVRYRVRWGGRQGLRVGIMYKALDWKWFKAFLRLDYRFSRGPGVAIETQYCSPDGTESFCSRNYAARDSSTRDPNMRFRYRLQGIYQKSFRDELLTLCGSYDKISDEDMPNDYSDKDLELKTAGKTQLYLRSQSCYGITDLTARIRANSFETVKEDLPAVGIALRPFTLGSSGVISENRFHFGYHDFRFSDELPTARDYNSTRVEFCHTLYRPFSWQWGTITPEAGAVAIYYGNSRDQSSKWVTLGRFGALASSTFHRYYGCYKHVITPYAHYKHFTKPNTGPDEHFIFDLRDGWDNLNTLRLGTRGLLYQKLDCGTVAYRMDADIYTYLFLDTPTIASTAPRLYTEVGLNASPSLRYSTLLVWNQERQILDEYNIRTQWTASESLAIDAEYRYRSDYRWRKVDPCNFVVDSFRTETALRASAMSDKRSTALVHAYYRMTYDLAVELRYRHGWKRHTQPDYNEYQFDLCKTLRSSWHLKLSYQYRESDHRMAVHIKIGQKLPSCRPCCCPSYSLLE